MQFFSAIGTNYLTASSDKTEQLGISTLSAIRVLEPLNCRKCKLELEPCRKCRLENGTESQTMRLAALRRLELDTGLGKLKFGFFHGLSEVEGRSELRMFNRLFFEAQFINSPAVSFSDFSKSSR